MSTLCQRGESQFKKHRTFNIQPRTSEFKNFSDERSERRAGVSPAGKTGVPPLGPSIQFPERRQDAAYTGRRDACPTRDADDAEGFYRTRSMFNVEGLIVLLCLALFFGTSSKAANLD